MRDVGATRCRALAAFTDKAAARQETT